MKSAWFARILAFIAIVQLGWPLDTATAGSSVVIPSLSRIVVPPPVRAAAAPPARETRTEAGTLATCLNCRTSTAVPPVPPAVKVNPVSITFRTRGKSLGASCRKLFMNEDGNYGPVGRKVASLISSGSYRSEFLNGMSLKPVCPKFNKLSKDQQEKAWVWFWMVLANEESTCNPNLRHATHFPDGRVLNPKPGWGLFAAELYPQHRKWRGSMCAGNIRETSVQVNCAVHTMAATQFRRGRGLLWSLGYWGPVRRAGRQIMPNMRGFKSCF